MRTLRYLHALGIERWVPRSAGGPPPSEPAPVRAVTSEPVSPEPVAALARAAMEAAPTVAPRPERPPLSAATAAAPTAEVEAGEVPVNVPRFRLLVLQLASSMLMIDEGLLGAPGKQAEAKLLLGDVLRTATLLHCGDAAGAIDSHVFYWPQVDDAGFDQGLPRAREALAYHVRQRAQSGVLLLVRPIDRSESPGDATRVLEGLEGLPVAPLELDAALMVNDGPAARAAVWEALQRLWRPA